MSEDIERAGLRAKRLSEILKSGRTVPLEQVIDLLDDVADMLEADKAGGEVYPPDGTTAPFTVINLGHGKVRIGDSIHDDRLPALWFGKEGKGIGHIEELNRRAKEGETLAVVTFSNVEGLDVLLDVTFRIRGASFQNAPSYTIPQPAQQPPDGWVLVPVEPTPGMLTAAGLMTNYDRHAPGASPDADHVEWYRDMLSAAPKP